MRAIRWLRRLVAVILPAAVLVAAPAAGAQPTTADIHSAGPITDVWVGTDLSCQVAYAGDSSYEFFPPSQTLGDCGTFVSIGGTLYGPDFANHPETATPFAGAGGYTPYASGSQSAVTGDGTSSSPLQVTTTVSLPGTAVTITQVDSYVIGDQAYRTQITLANSSGSPVTALLYRAGDCYLENSDLGYGAVDSGTNSPACTANPNNSPPGQVQEMGTITPATSYVETDFEDTWQDVENQSTLPNTCDCTTYEDNAEAVEWNVTLPAHGQTSFGVLGNYSPTGQLAGAPGVSSAGAPGASTGAPTVSSSTGAAFTGSVVPDGLPTTAHFEYGLDPKYTGGGAIVYDQSTPDQSVGSDFTAHSVAAQVSGLVPNALYHVRLVASNSAGTVDGPDVTFTTKKDPAPPPPVLGKSFDASVISGTIFIKLPGGSSGHMARVPYALTKGQGFEPLTEARQLPVGTQVDARQGTLQLVEAPPTPTKSKKGKKKSVPKQLSGKFSSGLFKVTQSRTGLSKGLMTLTLLEGAFKGAPSFAACTSTGKSAHVVGVVAKSKPLSSKVLQTLSASDNHGNFQTKGRYSAATVRGTVWSTTDQCNGTLTKVKRGTVSVLDFQRRKTITLHAGQSYLARALQSHKK